MDTEEALTDCKNILDAVHPSDDETWQDISRQILDLISACMGDMIDEDTFDTRATPSSVTFRKLTTNFEMIARCKRPLSSKRCAGAIASHLGQALRIRQSRWLTRLGVNGIGIVPQLKARRLKSTDHEIIRAEATRLAQIFQVRVDGNSSSTIPQQTALRGLAQIYASAVDFPFDAYQLPHAVESNFIQFCTAALHPFVPPTLCGEEALGTAWRRIKDAEKKTAP